MGWGLLYALVAGMGCFAIAAVQRRAARRSGSPLVEVEVKSWTIDGLMSAAVAIAFGISFLLQGSKLAGWLPYVDPIVVIALSVVALGLPLGIIRQNLGELLLAAPPVEVRHSLEERVRAIAHELPVDRTVIRTIKIGRQHWALVHILVEPGTPVGTIEDLDEVRRAIVAELAQIEPSWVVDVVFVADVNWL